MRQRRTDDVARAAAAHGESEEQVLDRNFVEILQELRVAQTGVQILFAFLLAIPFAAGWEGATDRQQVTYTATLLLSAAATATLIAPVAFHRLLFRRRQRRELVDVANRMALGGLLLLLLAVAGAVLLVLDEVLGGSAAWLLTGLTATWFVLLWIGIPLVHLRRARRAQEPSA